MPLCSQTNLSSFWNFFQVVSRWVAITFVNLYTATRLWGLEEDREPNCWMLCMLYIFNWKINYFPTKSIKFSILHKKFDYTETRTVLSVDSILIQKKFWTLKLQNWVFAKNELVTASGKNIHRFTIYQLFVDLN